MNTLISFELAKLLKEKGFDIPVNKYYEHALTSKKDSETNSYTGEFGWKKGETNLQDGYFINNFDIADLSNKNWYMCSAPTIAEVIMWLYEKHGIWIYSFRVKNYGEIKWYYTIETTEDILLYSPTLIFNSPTEAYSTAIEYTLKNLI